MAGERLQEALRAYRRRYQEAGREARTAILDEFCAMTTYHRKYAIALLGKPHALQTQPRRRRGAAYSPQAIRVIAFIWRAAGYPWSERLKALLPRWLPWARKRLGVLTPEVERQVLAISARQIDRRLAGQRRRLRGRLYGRTKPGTLLKRQIPIKTDSWDVTAPGSVEVDLVSHSGPAASGEFAYSLNVTDVFTGWCETRAILGRGEEAVVAALDEIRRALPFALRAIDSDNGSEFINHHLLGYCRAHGVRFTRSRPYQKNDNARVEQKNWTHVRRVFGWERFDTPQDVAAMNVPYRESLRLMMNLFQPSVKLLERQRVDGRLRRRYAPAETPLDRLASFYGPQAMPQAVRALLELRERADPFELAERIERELDAAERVRAGQAAPAIRPVARRPAPPPPPRRGGRAARGMAHAR